MVLLGWLFLTAWEEKTWLSKAPFSFKNLGKSTWVRFPVGEASRPKKRPTETHGDTSRGSTPASGCLKAIKYSLAKSKAWTPNPWWFANGDWDTTRSPLMTFFFFFRKHTRTTIPGKKMVFSCGFLNLCESFEKLFSSNKSFQCKWSVWSIGMARIQHGVVQNYEQFWILSLWENGTKYWTPSIIVSKQTKIPNRKNKHNTFCTSKNIPKKNHVLYELKCFLMFFLAAKKFPFQPPLFRLLTSFGRCSKTEDMKSFNNWEEDRRS